MEEDDIFPDYGGSSELPSSSPPPYSPPDIYKLDLFETCTVYDETGRNPVMRVCRVPGGWLMARHGDTNHVFVPHNEEYKGWAPSKKYGL